MVDREPWEPHDEDWFSAAYQEFAPLVEAYAARRASAHNVDDIVSETFMTLWRRRSDVPERLLPWLYRVGGESSGSLQPESSSANTYVGTCRGVCGADRED